MRLPTVEQRANEKALHDAVSPERLQEHLEVFSTLFRDSGSEDERKAAEYVVETVRGYGLEAEILEFDSLISWPLEGQLAFLDGDGRETEQIPVRTRSFGAQTRQGGIEAELIFVPFAAPKQGEMIFSHRAVAGRLRRSRRHRQDRADGRWRSRWDSAGPGARGGRPHPHLAQRRERHPRDDRHQRLGYADAGLGEAAAERSRCLASRTPTASGWPNR